MSMYVKSDRDELGGQIMPANNNVSSNNFSYLCNKPVPAHTSKAAPKKELSYLRCWRRISFDTAIEEHVDDHPGSGTVLHGVNLL